MHNPECLSRCPHCQSWRPLSFRPVVEIPVVALVVAALVVVALVVVAAAVAAVLLVARTVPAERWKGFRRSHLGLGLSGTKRSYDEKLARCQSFVVSHRMLASLAIVGFPE